MPFDNSPAQDFSTPEAPVVTKPFTVKHFTAWLQTRDPAETWNYLDSSDCLLCRYSAENGRPSIPMKGGLDNVIQAFGGLTSLVLSRVSSIAYQRPHNIAAALQRAIALSSKD